MRHGKMNAILASILIGCMSLSVQAQPSSQADPLELDDDDEVNTKFVEVPVDSIRNFVKIYGIVKDNYVDEKSDDVLFQQAIKGLVSGLDRYSRYLSPEEYKQLVQYTDGEIASVDFNLDLVPETKQWKIIDLKDQSDAYKLGLRNGQYISKIDNQDVLGSSHEQVQTLLYGSVGSAVQIQTTTMSNPKSLVRTRKIDADIQAQLLKNQVLVLRVKVFQQDTANQIKKILESYQAKHYKAVLIDLRNNPGGLLSAAVEAADLFLTEGIIVSTKSRSEGDQQFQALPGDEFQNIKVGILINHRSASAAEVFTAALKEHNRAWVIGEKSYGKGVVQKLFPLDDGSALQMTVSHYYTPSGKAIDSKGITPSKIYPLPKGMQDETYLDNAAEMLLKHNPNK